jgi:quinol monooxygenase YgiN
MVIASLVFDVLPDKRTEFVSAVGGWLDRLRAAQGCLGCRLAADFENQNVFVMTSEWDGKPFSTSTSRPATSRSSRGPASF